MPTDNNPFEARFFARLEYQRRQREPRPPARPRIRAMFDPLGVSRRPLPLWPTPAPKETRTMPTIAAKGAIKGVIVLDAAELAAVDVPAGLPRLHLTVRIPGAEGVGASVLIDLNAKTARKQIGVIRELGADNVAVFVQGKVQGSAMTECGLVVSPRKPKVEAPAETTAEPVAA